MWVWSLHWEDTLEEGRATNSSILAWRIPRTEEPGGLQSIALQRVGHDWSDLACMHTQEYFRYSWGSLDIEEIKPVNPKGNQPWVFTKGLMLKLQCFGYLMRRASSLEKTLMLGKIEGKRERGWERIKWLDSITNSVDEFEQTPGKSGRQKIPDCYSPWGHRVGPDLAAEQQQEVCRCLCGAEGSTEKCAAQPQGPQLIRNTNSTTKPKFSQCPQRQVR